MKEKLDKVPRSYTVTTPGGQELRRNRKHVKEVPPMINRYVINLQSRKTQNRGLEKRRRTLASLEQSPDVDAR